MKLLDGIRVLDMTNVLAGPFATGTTVKGVDVSIYQGTIDWTKVKAAGIDFRAGIYDFEKATQVYRWFNVNFADKLVRQSYRFDVLNARDLT